MTPARLSSVRGAKGTRAIPPCRRCRRVGGFSIRSLIDRKGREYLTRYCVPCADASNRRDPEKHRARVARWNRKHRDKGAEYQRRWRAKQNAARVSA